MGAIFGLFAMNFTDTRIMYNMNDMNVVNQLLSYVCVKQTQTSSFVGWNWCLRCV